MPYRNRKCITHSYRLLSPEPPEPNYVPALPTYPAIDMADMATFLEIPLCDLWRARATYQDANARFPVFEHAPLDGSRARQMMGVGAAAKFLNEINALRGLTVDRLGLLMWALRLPTATTKPQVAMPPFELTIESEIERVAALSSPAREIEAMKFWKRLKSAITAATALQKQGVGGKSGPADKITSKPPKWKCQPGMPRKVEQFGRVLAVMAFGPDNRMQLVDITDGEETVQQVDVTLPRRMDMGGERG